MNRATKALLVASLALGVFNSEGRADIEVDPPADQSIDHLAQAKSDSKYYFKSYLRVLKLRSTAQQKYAAIKEQIVLKTEKLNEENSKLSLLQADLLDLENSLATAPKQRAFIKKQMNQIGTQKTGIEQEILSLPEFSDKATPDQTQISNKISGINSQISQKRNEISSLQSQIQSLKDSSEYRNKVAERNRMRTALANAQAEESRLESEINSLSWEISTNRNNASDARNKINRIDTRSNRIANRLIPEKRRENQNRRQQIQNLDGQIQQSQTRLAELRPKLENNRNRRQTLKSELAPMENRLSTLQQRLQKLRQDKKNAATPEEKAQIQTKIDNLRDQKVKPLRQRVNAKKDQLTKARERGKNLRTRIKRNEDRIQSANRDIQRMRQVNKRNRREIAELENESNRLATRKNEWQNYIDRLNVEYGQLDFEINSARNQLISTQSGIRSYESSLSSAQARINAFVRQNIRPLESNISGIESDIGGLQARISVLNSYSSKLQRNMDNKAMAETKLVELDQLIQNFPQLVQAKKKLVSDQELDVAKALKNVQRQEYRATKFKERINSLPARVKLLEQGLKEKIQLHKDSI